MLVSITGVVTQVCVPLWLDFVHVNLKTFAIKCLYNNKIKHETITAKRPEHTLPKNDRSCSSRREDTNRCEVPTTRYDTEGPRVFNITPWILPVPFPEAGGARSAAGKRLPLPEEADAPLAGPPRRGYDGSLIWPGMCLVAHDSHTLLLQKKR